MEPNKLLKISLATIFTLVTWLTLYHLLQLLTFSTKSDINNNNQNNNNQNNNNNVTINLFTGVPTFDQIKDIFFNSVLISVFIFQHSFMASSGYKSFISSSNFFRPLQRSMYNFFTSLTIEFMISNWQSVNSFIIWDLSKYESNLSTLKTIFLIIILFEFFLFLNFFEFFGISQVWSHCIKNKEYELPIEEKNRLYSIMRHPNTVSLLIIIWFSPIRMTLDLFTVCTFFTFYLLCGNSK
ncbi:hypothetical protein DDB_G0288111 [Dictyostelium discoideum AX4]|uniref:Nuclear envelope membrane protein n=1 Tax=Dictyostelium discoideum TaxID=44689 RepID=Q54JG5_DICDI|nr:hypothetical protein DDB_G0288111 [Dictyostelium discoideum AX4]EAL63400.1 hypothetical protein DDB_G0288111 [Dictyostelium discoideum AX4]|eukprot:XP_636885.1 hypothetical protein DDB_G0288111 [Dictyostelium discoideum AX4]